MGRQDAVGSEGAARAIEAAPSRTDALEPVNRAVEKIASTLAAASVPWGLPPMPTAGQRTSHSEFDRKNQGAGRAARR